MCVPYWQEGKEATEKHLFHCQMMEQPIDLSPCRQSKYIILRCATFNIKNQENLTGMGTYCLVSPLLAMS